MKEEQVSISRRGHLHRTDLLWKEKAGWPFPHPIVAWNSKEAQPTSSALASGHHEDLPAAQEGNATINSV